MNEIRKNHIVQIETKNKTILDGIIFDYTHDRILILISFDSLLEAKKINELDELLLSINTHLGIKKMKCHVIGCLNKDNCIIVENNEAIPVVQKREHVRVLSDLQFLIQKNDEIYNCFCINISAGGIAFWCSEHNFILNEQVKIIFAQDDFGKEIICEAQILKIHETSIVAKYINLKPFDEDRIVKYVFKMITKK